ncbi:MAG: hypothetical protein JOY60_05565 [Burkholderiaceae bacterium]|nr:hypothetical protein [Roseateles sp.]MBV8469314.1 hypothetical protein [Burkholderiaceae bacterium]
MRVREPEYEAQNAIPPGIGIVPVFMNGKISISGSFSGLSRKTRGNPSETCCGVNQCEEMSAIAMQACDERRSPAHLAK